MPDKSYFRIQFIVFTLVSASFTNIYITQPISVFNFLPFRLAADPFGFSTELTTLFYVVYVVGIFIGPTAGKISNRFGNGNTLIGGSVVMGGSLLLILLPLTAAVVIGLLGICTGFFTIHSAAVGSLNRKLISGQGRANALYILFYYLGGWFGITCAGFLFKQIGWSAVVYFCAILLLIPLLTGIRERNGCRNIESFKVV